MIRLHCIANPSEIRTQYVASSLDDSILQEKFFSKDCLVRHAGNEGSKLHSLVRRSLAGDLNNTLSEGPDVKTIFHNYITGTTNTLYCSFFKATFFSAQSHQLHIDLTFTL